jgi:hypothetical protein
VNPHRRRLRLLRAALATVGGLRPQGFFLPYRHAATVTPTDYPATLPLLEAALPRMLGVLGAIRSYAGRLAELDGPAPRPRFDQDWFPRLDAAAAYALVCSRRPRQIVEIGSGHSTRFMAQALADAGHGGRLTAIDPAPRASLAGLPIEHRAEPLSPAAVGQLAAGDILFVDSSHLLVPGSDVDLVLSAILPRLPQGALVHVHDIFLPDPYPAGWAWRGYNEQPAIAALLLGGGYRVLFASRFLVTRHPEPTLGALPAALPLPAGAIETSLWLEKNAAAIG